MGLLVLLAIVIGSPRRGSAQEKPTLVIGGADSRVVELVGPQSVIVTGNRIVIVEGSAPYFRVFTPAGALVQSFGRAGAGPGEIGKATFWYDSTRREIVAFDRGNGRVSLYSLGDSIRFAGSHPSSVRPWGGCVVGGVPWALSVYGALITELKLSSDHYVAGRKIGEARWLNPEAAQPDLRQFSGLDLSLQCDPGTRTAVVVSELFGEAHVLSLDTGKDQLVKLLDFIPAHVVASATSVSQEYPSDQIVDALAGMIATSAGVEVLVSHYTPKSLQRNMPESIRHILVLADGTQRVVGRSTAWRPMAIARDGAYCYASDPEPTIARFASGRCP